MISTIVSEEIEGLRPAHEPDLTLVQCDADIDSLGSGQDVLELASNIPGLRKNPWTDSGLQQARPNRPVINRKKLSYIIPMCAAIIFSETCHRGYSPDIFDDSTTALQIIISTGLVEEWGFDEDYVHKDVEKLFEI